MLKYQILFIVSIMIWPVAFCQKNEIKKKVSDTNDIRPYYIDINFKKNDKIAVSGFNHIIISDCRYDTTFLGFVAIDLKAGLQSLTFEGGVSKYLNKKANELIKDNSGSDTLYIKLNDLIFKETISQKGWLHAVALGSERTISNIFFNADMFVTDNGKIRKIGSIDTIFTGKGWMPDNCNKLSEKVLKTAVSFSGKAARASEALIGRLEFDSIVSPGNLPPILKDDKFNRGIYFSFEQFLNNDPTEILFQVEKMSKNVKLLYKQTEDTTADMAWGFSDGEDIYMHLDSGYYKLERKKKHIIVSAPITIEIINAFATVAIQRTLQAAVSWYFIYENPFKIFALKDFFGSNPKNQIYYKYYNLNLTNGKLR